MLLINSGVEQLAARKAHNLEVGGSSPPPAPKTKNPIVRWDFLFCIIYTKPYLNKKSFLLLQKGFLFW